MGSNDLYTLTPAATTTIKWNKALQLSTTNLFICVLVGGIFFSHSSCFCEQSLINNDSNSNSNSNSSSSSNSGPLPSDYLKWIDFRSQSFIFCMDLFLLNSLKKSIRYDYFILLFIRSYTTNKQTKAKLYDCP